jgi:hypothetical protein
MLTALMLLAFTCNDIDPSDFVKTLKNESSEVIREFRKLLFDRIQRESDKLDL